MNDRYHTKNKMLAKKTQMAHENIANLRVFVLFLKQGNKETNKQKNRGFYKMPGKIERWFCGGTGALGYNQSLSNIHFFPLFQKPGDLLGFIFSNKKNNSFFFELFFCYSFAVCRFQPKYSTIQTKKKQKTKNKN